MGLLFTTPLAVVLRDFFLANAWSRAIPHAWRLLGRPPEMVGLCVELYAPMPLLTTFLAVGNVIFLLEFALLYSFKNALNFLVRPSLNLIDLLDEAEAVPRLLVLLPLIRSFFGAGVWAAPFLPALLFAMTKNKKTPSREEASYKCSSLLLLQLHNDDTECRQNQEVVNILSAQKWIGVFDVEKSFHDYFFLC